MVHAGECDVCGGQRTKQNRIFRTVRKEAALIRVSRRIAAGAAMFSVSSSRTLQRGGSLLETGS